MLTCHTTSFCTKKGRKITHKEIKWDNYICLKERLFFILISYVKDVKGELWRNLPPKKQNKNFGKTHSRWSQTTENLFEHWTQLVLSLDHGASKYFGLTSNLRSRAYLHKIATRKTVNDKGCNERNNQRIGQCHFSTHQGENNNDFVRVYKTWQCFPWLILGSIRRNQGISIQ